MITGAIVVVRPAAQTGVTAVGLIAGPAGKSAYQTALDLGFTGTTAQWLSSLIGATGNTGPAGGQGIQGVQGNVGPTGPLSWATPPSAWLASTAYTAAAPASVVTYSGESYVCSNSHTSGTTFDSTQWVKIAAKGADGSPSAGAVLYTAQSLTTGQQDQTRANIAAPTSSAPGSATTLTGTDIDRPLYPTGTITITAASLANANWRSGPILNSNTTSGSITLAVPSGATLDGVTNGTTTLLPKQKARIVQTGASAYITDWIDRSPVVASAKITSAVASVDLLLPAGYASFDFVVSGVKVDTAGASVGARFASDAATFRAGTSDYYQLATLATNSSTSVSSAYNTASYMELGFSLQASAGIPLNARGTIHPGDASTQALMLFLSTYFTNGSVFRTVDYTQAYAGGSNALMNAVRVLATTGNITAGSIAIRGIPAP